MINAATAMLRVFMRTPSPDRSVVERQHTNRAEHECARATACGRVGTATESARRRLSACHAESAELLGAPVAGSLPTPGRSRRPAHSPPRRACSASDRGLVIVVFDGPSTSIGRSYQTLGSGRNSSAQPANFGF
jgi:hypothetical protein